MPSPPRPPFIGDLREQGLQRVGEGLSRESVRRERQGLAGPVGLCRPVERPGVGVGGGRDRERFALQNGVADLGARQGERLGGKQWGQDVSRTHSPGRGLERGERGLVMSERLGLERSGLDRGGSDRGTTSAGGVGRERSLSPRSKEALREMQLARERRAKGAVQPTARCRF
jgi:hypothetical protein